MRLFGSAAARTASGATPLHAAAARRDASAAGVASALLAGGDDAVATWLAARDRRGVTPSRLAGAGPHDLAALDAAVRAVAAIGVNAAVAAAGAVEAERGIFEPKQRAEAAEALLRSAPASADADAAARGLAIAILLADAESPDASDEAELRAALEAAALAEPWEATDLTYSAWMLVRNRTLLLGWAFAILFLYHGVRMRTALWAQPLAPLIAAQKAMGKTVQWKQALPLYRAMLADWKQLAIEVPSLLVLVLPLLPFAPRAARAWLLRNATAVLVMQHLIHFVVATLIEVAALASVTGGFLVNGEPPVYWPTRLARHLAWATFSGHLCWPLPLPYAAVLIMLRSTLPFTRFWLATPMPGGAIEQLAGAAVAAAFVVWRERKLRPVYRAEMAARRAVAEAKAIAASAE
jgi:hypothetical protein